MRGCVADRLRPTLPLDVELDKERHGIFRAHHIGHQILLRRVGGLSQSLGYRVSGAPVISCACN